MQQTPRYGIAPPTGRRWRIYEAFVVAVVAYLLLTFTVGDRFWPVQMLDYVALLILPLAFILLPIAIIRQKWGAVALQMVCAFAFAWMLQASVAANDPESPPVADDGITVMTYNLGNGLATPDQLMPMLRDSGAHIIALQEVTPEIAAAIETDLADVYPYRVVRGLGIPGKALLSQFPIVDYEWLTFDPDRPDLRATLDLNGTSVVVVVAHPPPPELTWSGVTTRDHTAEQFAGLLNIVRTTDEPLLLLGDFNITQIHDAYGELESTGLFDAYRVAGEGLGFTAPVRMAKLTGISDMLGEMFIWPTARIDYVWTSPEWQPLDAWIGPDAGSDHLPVFARLSLTGVRD